ncbi:MAG: hypothetical protein IPL86_08250 [Flavobacteriales bacterium]|jgi:hypothetical protein|nr:hypothetical protein [Flavobacteriales bacterium]
MAIFTPRGLKIRLDTDLAFTYIARLQPKFTAFQVLKTVEGIELIPNLFAVLTGIYMMLNNYDSINIAVAVFVAMMIGGIATAFGLYVIPFLVRSATAISYIHGFGIFSIVIIVTGLLTVGWQGVLFYFIGRYSASLFLSIMDFLQMYYIRNRTGVVITASERNFYNAYRLLASQIGISASLELKEGEVESGKWELPYLLMKQKWPQVTSRFTIDT